MFYPLDTAKRHKHWQCPFYEKQEFFKKTTRHCIVIVIWNEGERIKKQLQQMRAYSSLADIIIADGNSNDGSTDHALLKQMGVRSLLVTKEKGLSTATRMALAYAMEQDYQGVIKLDGNGKDGVDAIPAFIEKLDEGYDFVQGSRFMKGGVHENTPLERYIGVRFVIAPLLALGGFWYTDPTNAFRAMSTQFLLDRRVQPIRAIFVRFNLHHYLLFSAARLKFKITEIPVSRVYPDDGSVPTKIKSIDAKYCILKELIETILGRYNPKEW